MARATKILNKYEIKLLALSDRDINYDNFYKEKLIAFCKCLKEEYKKQKEAIDKAITFYETNKQECVIGRTGEGKLRKGCYLPAHLSKTLIDILKEVSE